MGSHINAFKIQSLTFAFTWRWKVMMKNNIAQCVIWFYKALSELIQLICKQGKPQKLSFHPSSHIDLILKLCSVYLAAALLQQPGLDLLSWFLSAAVRKGTRTPPGIPSGSMFPGQGPTDWAQGGRFFRCFGANTIASWGRDLACVSWESRACVSSPLPPSELD